MKLQAKRLLVRTALITLFLFLIVFSFLRGRGHSLLIDNKDSPDGSVKAINGLLVSIDGREEKELYLRDRVLEKVKGQTHSIKITSLKDGKVFETRITLPLMSEMMLLSIPMLLAGKEPYLSVFVPLDQAPSNDEPAGNSNSYTSPDALAPEVPVMIE